MKAARPYADIGSEVKRTREALGLSQSAFSDLVGVHGMTVSKWERGVARPVPYQMAVVQVFGAAVTLKEGNGVLIAERFRDRGPLRALHLAMNLVYKD